MAFGSFVVSTLKGSETRGIFLNRVGFLSWLGSSCCGSSTTVIFSIIGRESVFCHVFIDAVLLFLFLCIFCFDSVNSALFLRFQILSNLPSIFFVVLWGVYDAICYNFTSNSASSYSSTCLPCVSIETRPPDSWCRFWALRRWFFILWLITVCIRSIWRAISIFFFLLIILCLLSSYSWSAF